MPAKIYYASQEVLSPTQTEWMASRTGVIGFMPVFEDAAVANDYAEENDTTLVSFMAEEPDEEDDEEDVADD